MKSDRTIHGRVLDYAYVDMDTLYRDFDIPDQGYDEEQMEESLLQLVDSLGHEYE